MVSWSEVLLSCLGSVLMVAAICGLVSAWRFVQLTAWEFPAYVLLGLSITVMLFGLVLVLLGVTSRTPEQTRRRLKKSLLLLGSLGVSLYSSNKVLGWLEPGSRLSWDVPCDNQPFHENRPLCETDQPGVSPIEARYSPNLTLRHCAQDFDVTVHTTALGLRSIDRKPTAPATLAIGDSFCFGWGVEDDQSYPAILGWQNAGLWGRPPSASIKSLQWWAPRLEPRRVVWEIYLPHLITELPDAWQSPYQYPRLDGPLSRAILVWYHETGVGRFLHHRFGLAINRDNYFTKALMLYRDPTPELTDVYVSLGRNFRIAKQLADEFGFEIWFVLLPSKGMLKIHESDSAAARLPMDRLKEQIVGAGFAPKHVIDLLPVFVESKNQGCFILGFREGEIPLTNRQ